MAEFLLRDTRHLAGREQAVDAPPLPAEGHAVSFHWTGTEPALVVRDEAGRHWSLPLDDRFDLEVLDERVCIGRRTDAGAVPCPAARPVDRFAQCRECHPLPDRDCVFNPRCHDCALDFCRGPHKVYVTFYGTLPKVGMTRDMRGETRLIEQGSDAYAFVADVADRFEARRVEDRVSAALDLPQARRAKEILPLMARATPWEAIERAYAAMQDGLERATDQAPGPLVRIEGHPGTWPLSQPPNPARLVGRHRGGVRGVKGKFVVYEDASGVLWALRASGVETHRVRFDPDEARPYRDGAWDAGDDEADAD